MTLRDLVRELGLTLKSGEAHLDREVTGGYVADLLSDVMAGARAGNVWVTLQVHENIVAVASLVGVAGIITVRDREPEPETLSRAEKEGVPILVSSLSAFDLVGRLYDLGLGER